MASGTRSDKIFAPNPARFVQRPAAGFLSMAKEICEFQAAQGSKLEQMPAVLTGLPVEHRAVSLVHFSECGRRTLSSLRRHSPPHRTDRCPALQRYPLP